MSSTTPHQIYTDDDYYLLKSQYDRLLDLVNPHATGDWEYDLETTGKSMVKLIEDNDTYILKQQNERLNDRSVLMRYSKLRKRMTMTQISSRRKL